MATKTINQFGVITTLATNDKLPLWQNSSAATKAVTYGNFITQVIASLTLSDYVKKDGSVALTGDWDIGAGRKISGDKLAARSASGLRLEDDGSNAGVIVTDGGTITLASLATDWDIGSGRKISGDKLAARSASGLRLEDDGGNLGIFVADGGGVSIASTTQESTSTLTVNGGNLSVVRSAADSTVKIISYRESAATHSRLLGSAARGTEGTPAAVQTNDLLLNIAAQGYHSGAAFGQEVGYLAFHAAENFTSSAQGCYMTLLTTPTGSTTRAERIRILANGNVGIGNTAAQALLHVGAGADAPATTATIYASLAGAVSIVARDSTNDVEARLTAGTAGVIFGAATNHPLSLYTNNAERMTILAGGNVGVANTSPQAALHVGAGADAPATTATIYASLAGAVSIVARDSTNDVEARLTAGTAGVIFGAATNHPLSLYSNNTERVVVLAGGAMLVNASASVTGSLGAGQVEINKASNGTMILRRDSADTGGPTLEFLKRRSGFGVLSNGDRLGTIGFSGADGTDANLAAAIYSEVDGAMVSDLPGRLIFATQPDGFPGLVEAMRITSVGRVGIGTDTPGYVLDVDGIINATDIYKNGSPFSTSSQWTDVAAGINYSGGDVGINDATPSAKLDVNGAIRGAYDTNTTCYLGKAAIGYDGSTANFATFALIGHNTATEANVGVASNDWLILQGTEVQFATVGTKRAFVSAVCVGPWSDDQMDLGLSGNRWDDVWATNGTIQTSDLSRKREVRSSVLGLDFIRRLQPIQWIWADRDEPAETETVVSERPVMETVVIEKHVIERTKNGKAIRRKKAVEVERQKMTLEPIYHENGKPVLDENGKPVLEAVPVLETFTEERIIKAANQKIHARPHFGLAGQQVKAVIDEMGTDFGGYIYDPERDEHSLRYTEFIAPLIKANQELAVMIEALASRIQTLEGMRS